MTNQPESLRVADALETYGDYYMLDAYGEYYTRDAARLLREQHAEIERLRDALQRAEKIGQQQDRMRDALALYAAAREAAFATAAMQEDKP